MNDNRLNSFGFVYRNTGFVYIISDQWQLPIRIGQSIFQSSNKQSADRRFTSCNEKKVTGDLILVNRRLSITRLLIWFAFVQPALKVLCRNGHWLYPRLLKWNSLSLSFGGCATNWRNGKWSYRKLLFFGTAVLFRFGNICAAIFNCLVNSLILLIV